LRTIRQFSESLGTTVTALASSVLLAYSLTYLAKWMGIDLPWEISNVVVPSVSLLAGCLVVFADLRKKLDAANRQLARRELQLYFDPSDPKCLTLPAKRKGDEHLWMTLSTIRVGIVNHGEQREDDVSLRLLAIDPECRYWEGNQPLTGVPFADGGPFAVAPSPDGRPTEWVTLATHVDPEEHPKQGRQESYLLLEKTFGLEGEEFHLQVGLHARIKCEPMTLRFVFPPIGNPSVEVLPFMPRPTGQVRTGPGITPRPPRERMIRKHR
jgi:hypothetical protein